MEKSSRVRPLGLEQKKKEILEEQDVCCAMPGPSGLAVHVKHSSLTVLTVGKRPIGRTRKLRGYLLRLRQRCCCGQFPHPPTRALLSSPCDEHNPIGTRMARSPDDFLSQSVQSARATGFLSLAASPPHLARLILLREVIDFGKHALHRSSLDFFQLGPVFIHKALDCRARS